MHPASCSFAKAKLIKPVLTLEAYHAKSLFVKDELRRKPLDIQYWKIVGPVVTDYSLYSR